MLPLLLAGLLSLSVASSASVLTPRDPFTVTVTITNVGNAPEMLPSFTTFDQHLYVAVRAFARDGQRLFFIPDPFVSQPLRTTSTATRTLAPGETLTLTTRLNETKTGPVNADTWAEYLGDVSVTATLEYATDHGPVSITSPPVTIRFRRR